MSDTFMGELRIMSFQQAPVGWAQCNGQLLPINQNQALFSLLGTTYGGNGSTNFALPDLRGRVAMNKTVNSNAHTQGEIAGEQAHTVSLSELPTHNHNLQARAATADQNVGGITPSPTQSLAQGIVSLPNNQTTGANLFATGSPAGTMGAASVSSVGGGQPHDNMQPYLTLNFCIALQGAFPSQA
jgi:microcystin-dependent protein